MKRTDSVHTSRSGAVIDGSGRYRYALWRSWDASGPRVLFVMLNPSTADADADDPTIRRCIGFAKAWSFGSLEVVNLFGYRAAEPNRLRTADDPIGPENDEYILDAGRRAARIVLGWGAHGTYRGRDRDVLRLLRAYTLQCIAVTKDGHPRHPLYLAASLVPVDYGNEWL